MTDYYNIMVQHSEACLDYYRALKKPATPHQRLQTHKLVSEYARHFLETGECMKEVYKDTSTFKRLRYSLERGANE